MSDPIDLVEVETAATIKKRKLGTPTGNAGEYFVMGELLRRGFNAQLADRNTKGYDVLVGDSENKPFQPVQIKTVRSAPWYVKISDFKDVRLDLITIYVLIGDERAMKPVRFFIARNRDVAGYVHQPSSFTRTGFMPLKAFGPNHEADWKIFGNPVSN
jgi:hypothetical protein